MPDFSHLLRKPAAGFKRPPVLPAGHYPGVVISHEFGESNSNKTPYARFMLRPLSWPADAPQEWEVADSATKTVYTASQSSVDLSKRQLRRDFFLRDREGSDEVMWRLAEFLKSIGLPTENADFETLIPQAIGASVLIEVQQYVNDKGEVGNQVGALRGQ